MARMHLHADDEGKPLVDSNGEKIGMIAEVEDGTAHVDPDPGITGMIRSKLGWGDTDGGDYALDSDRINIITDDEVRLEDSF